MSHTISHTIFTTSNTISNAIFNTFSNAISNTTSTTISHTTPLASVFLRLYLCVGDVLQSMVLKRISARNAKHVVILPNNSHSHTTTMNSSDAASVLISQAFESFTKNEWAHSEPRVKDHKTFEHITTVLTMNNRYHYSYHPLQLTLLLILLLNVLHMDSH